MSGLGLSEGVQKTGEFKGAMGKATLLSLKRMQEMGSDEFKRSAGTERDEPDAAPSGFPTKC